MTVRKNAHVTHEGTTLTTPVTQITPVDLSLASNADYASFSEYRIESGDGTTYVVDSANEIVYTFTPLGGTAALEPTNGSYDVFLAFLAANPVTSTESPPDYTGPSSTAAITITEAFFEASGAEVPDNLTSYETAVLQRLDMMVMFARATWLAVQGLQGPVSDPADGFPANETAAAADGALVWK